ncbi:response regulator [Oceanicoccus sagamiensis]|uniref:response regulator n=1 Tax=Oceanicoccus sagamiensis TaxID=716816 RepID=UPI00146C7392|nr:response regulator [Oceanicoccus sagamiensis]
MQLALIVDDSKTARLLLRKMLGRQDIPVAMVESGEEALEYLKDNTPDVIFMDHMMPGMDGFAAVKAIKADPDKSAIPIVMHTTKQGDIYLGQARALGAVDILTKPASDQDLSAVLDRITAQVEQPAPLAAEPVMTLAADPVESQMSNGLAAVEANGVSPAPSFYGTARQWLVAAIWLAPTLWLLTLYWSDQAEIKQLQRQQGQAFAAIEVLINRQQTYDYGEVPLGGARLALLKGLLPLLENTGFKGAIRLEGHIGDFCLSQIPLADGTEVMMLPSPELPLTACDVIGVSSAEAMRLSVEQSSEFARLRQRYESRSIRIEVAAYGANSPQQSYPVDLEAVTTGDWNAVALDNNRVNYLLIAD